MIAYLDESGTHGDGSPAVILGGFVANESAWPAYESDLQALFGVHALDHFHANKFRKRSGPFKGWSAAQQRVFVSDFFSLIDKHLAFGFAVTCKRRDYADIYKAGTTSRKVRKDSHYGLCFRLCLSAAVRFVSEMRHEWPLTVVLESGHANSGDAERIFDEMKSSLPPGLLGLMILKKKTDCLRLAPADALVHSLFRSKTTGRPIPETITRENVSINEVVPQQYSSQPRIQNFNLTQESLGQLLNDLSPYKAP